MSIPQNEQFHVATKKRYRNVVFVKIRRFLGGSARLEADDSLLVQQPIFHTTRRHCVPSDNCRILRDHYDDFGASKGVEPNCSTLRQWVLIMDPRGSVRSRLNPSNGSDHQICMLTLEMRIELELGRNYAFTILAAKVGGTGAGGGGMKGHVI